MEKSDLQVDLKSGSLRKSLLDLVNDQWEN